MKLKIKSTLADISIFCERKSNAELGIIYVYCFLILFNDSNDEKKSTDSHGLF